MRLWRRAAALRTVAASRSLLHGFATKSYELKRGGTHESEAWVADFSATGLTAADFKGLQELGEFMKSGRRTQSCWTSISSGRQPTAEKAWKRSGRSWPKTPTRPS